LQRDRLAILARLRDAAVTEASRALASARSAARETAVRLDVHNARTLQEQSQAGDMEGAAFSLWLPQARRQEASLRRQLGAEEARIGALLQVLVACRTDAEAVAKAIGRQQEAAAAVAARREQQVLDEAAGTRSTVHCTKRAVLF
jgi:hypothetical protein